MPYTLKDFLPFFKSIEKPIGFIENETITSNKVILWDDTELIGDVTFYINDARIEYQKVKGKRTQMCYNKCNNIRGSNNGNYRRTKVLHLPGVIIPPGITPSVATSRNMILPNGYDLTTKYDNFRSLTREGEEVNRLKYPVIYNYLTNTHPVGADAETDKILREQDVQRLINDKRTWDEYKKSYGEVILLDPNNYDIKSQYIDGYMINPHLVDRVTGTERVRCLMGVFIGLIYGRLFQRLIVVQLSPVHVYFLTDYTIAQVTIPGGFEFVVQDSNELYIYDKRVVNIFGGTANNSGNAIPVIASYTLNGTFLLELRNFYYEDKMIEFLSINTPLTFEQGKHTSQTVDMFHYKNLYYMKDVTVEAYIINSVAHFDIPSPSGALYFGNLFFTNQPVSIGAFTDLDINAYGLLGTGSPQFQMTYTNLKAFCDPATNNVPTLDILGTFNICGFIYSDDVEYQFRITYNVPVTTFNYIFYPIRKLYLGRTGKDYVENVKVVRFDNPSIDEDTGALMADVTVYGDNGNLTSRGDYIKVRTQTISSNVEYRFTKAIMSNGNVSFDECSVINYATEMKIYGNRGNFDLPRNNKLITMFTDLS